MGRGVAAGSLLLLLPGLQVGRLVGILWRFEFAWRTALSPRRASMPPGAAPWWLPGRRLSNWSRAPRLWTLSGLVLTTSTKSWGD
ncbi:MAG: hypothetical protein QOJ29_1139 [Thermoleophilaceae bacterium]|nr:hypothetical protein [Thermoleophilaceae bacterium]